MRFPGVMIFRWLTWAAACLGMESVFPASSTIQFNRDIRPILSDQCFACHGFDAKHRKAGLRLDTAEGAYAANKDGRVALKPGDPAGSELWRRITTTDPDDLMPPPESHKSLDDAQRALIRRWIEEGAPYQKHWAFEPPAPVTPPAPAFGPAPNPVDRFIHSRLRQEGLQPSPEADAATLIRRLTFDLTGLPPTPQEVDDFLADRAPGAYERLVDRLLASPRFGERMARHWLDVARYADTHGLHLDNERQMWAYRDWVVGAFNRNLPFDQFTIEQLAGDLLPQPTLDQWIATGFNRCNVTTSEGGSIDAEFIFRYAVERTSTTVQTWMGLTAGCAVCHDHKFDPISHREFYSLYAFFHSAADPAMDGNILLTPPIKKLASPEDEAALAHFDARLKDIESRIATQARAIPYTDPAEADPLPEPKPLSVTWVDDDVPAGWRISASPGQPSRWVERSEVIPVQQGNRALQRTDAGLAQDVLEGGAPFDIPASPRLFVHVRLDPANPPRTLMIQYRTDDWKHRMVWGDIDAIDWGAKGTTQRAHGGPLPEAGVWTRLEFDADKVGLKAGDKINGIAFTQFGGTVFWDAAGVVGTLDPARDPSQSFAAWLEQQKGRDVSELPAPLRKVLKDVASTNRTPEQVAGLREQYLARFHAGSREAFAPLITELQQVRKERNERDGSIPSTFVWKDMDQPRDSFVMSRGAYDRPGEKVTRGVPAVLPPLKTEGTPSRLDFAKWLLSPEHPLTARVAANRLWQQFFGEGLVRSTEDFGSQGEVPSHPELLDWLALHYRDIGWDTKALIRLLVTSTTYRQASRVTPELLARDADNRLLARSPRFRLDAEQLRDNALFVSGLADLTMGGKGVRTYQPPNIWEPVGFVGSNTRDYKQDSGSALYRRSLYVFFKRTAPPPFMTTFDAPNREASCSRRERSNTPLQALQLMNDIQHFEAARNLAQRMLVEGGSTAASRIQFAWRTVLSRVPDARELAVTELALGRHLERYRQAPDDAKQAIAFGESPIPSHLDPAELAAYTLTANLLLNLDETLTRN